MNYLLISTRFPYPPVKGDQVVLFNRIKNLSSDYNLTLLVLDNKDSICEESRSLVEKYCRVIFIESNNFQKLCSVLLGLLSNIPLQTCLYLTGARKREINKILNNNFFDIVNFHLLRTYSDDFNIPNGSFVVVDLIDSMVMNFKEILPALSFFKRIIYKEELRRLRIYEASIPFKVDLSIVVSEKDRNFIGSPNVHVVPNGVDSDLFFPKSIKDKNLIIFSGNMSYAPNIIAVKWFLPVFGRLKKEFNQLKFRVVGANISSDLRNILDDEGVEYTGYVDDMPLELSKAVLAIAPIFHASGMQNKIIEAWSCGVPVVMSSKVSVPFLPDSNEFCVVADTQWEYYDAIKKLLSNEEKLNYLAIRVRDHAIAKYSWFSSYRKFTSAINTIKMHQ